MMFTARDLLYKALDYDGFWNTSQQMLNTKPSQLRQLQLEKLLTGFGISKTNAKPQSQIKGGHQIVKIYFTSRHPKQMDRPTYLKTLTNFKYFATGEFISDISREKYQNLIDRIIATSKNVFPEQSEIIDKEPINLVSLFHDLYNFRVSVYHTIKYHFSKKRMKLFSTEDDYALYLRNKFILSMDTKLSEIDEILCAMIDPEKKIVKGEEINYPSDDLKAIDDEWENNERQESLNKS
jgi:hypothetical protein